LGYILEFQVGPRFQQGLDAVLIIQFGAGFGVGIVFKALQIDAQCVAKLHFSQVDGGGTAGFLALVFLEIGQPEFGHREGLGFEAPANELALHPYPGKIGLRWPIANQVCKRCFLPIRLKVGLGWLCFHANSIRLQYQIVK
jgi:hypothetical protein